MKQLITNPLILVAVNELIRQAAEAAWPSIVSAVLNVASEATSQIIQLLLLLLDKIVRSGGSPPGVL